MLEHFAYSAYCLASFFSKKNQVVVDQMLEDLPYHVTVE